MSPSNGPAPAASMHLPESSNGTGPQGGWKNYLIGLLATALIAGGGGLVNAVVGHGQAISVLETQRSADKEQVDRIERKIDRILDHGRP